MRGQKIAQAYKAVGIEQVSRWTVALHAGSIRDDDPLFCGAWGGIKPLGRAAARVGPRGGRCLQGAARSAPAARSAAPRCRSRPRQWLTHPFNAPAVAAGVPGEAAESCLADLAVLLSAVAHYTGVQLPAKLTLPPHAAHASVHDRRRGGPSQGSFLGHAAWISVSDGYRDRYDHTMHSLTHSLTRSCLPAPSNVVGAARCSFAPRRRWWTGTRGGGRWASLTAALWASRDCSHHATFRPPAAATCSPCAPCTSARMRCWPNTGRRACSGALKRGARGRPSAGAIHACGRVCFARLGPSPKAATPTWARVRRRRRRRPFLRQTPGPVTSWAEP